MSAWLAALRRPSVTNQPPTDQELRRTDWAVVVFIAFCLFLGIGISSNAATASRSVSLGEGLPTIAVPTNWIMGTREGAILFVRNPRSGSTFNSEVSVATRPIGPTDNVVTVRTGLGAQHARDMLYYRELAADAVTVNGQDGVIVNYAYVADPTREQGAIAPPVVVQARDLIFPSGSQMVIVTMSADTAVLDTQDQYFLIVTDSLRVRVEPAEPATEPVSEPVTSEEGGE